MNPSLLGSTNPGSLAPAGVAKCKIEEGADNVLSHAFLFGAICTLWDHRQVHLGCNALTPLSTILYLGIFGLWGDPLPAYGSHIELRGFGS